MRAHFLAFAFLTAFYCAVSTITFVGSVQAAQSVALQKLSVHGAVLYAVTTDLNDPSIKVEVCLAARGIPHSESFKSMVGRCKPLAAVTGTYFDTRTLFPVGSIVSDGMPLHESAIGTAVCFLRNSAPKAVTVATAGAIPQPTSYTVRFVPTKKGDRCDWTGVECGLRTGPRLLSNGAYALNPRPEGFRHPGLFGSRTRMALGITPNNKLILVAVRTPVTFGRLASIMKALGATEAVALDGGTSSAMSYGSRIVCRPGRALTNIITVRRVTPVEPANEVAKAPHDLVLTSIQATHAGPAGGKLISRRYPDSASASFAVYDGPVARLSLSESRRAFFPVNRAQFARLKGFDNSDHLVHISANAKVMHHLIA